jgi:hypothetical protein
MALDELLGVLVVGFASGVIAGFLIGVWTIDRK